jgi:hypothetical protein
LILITDNAIDLSKILIDVSDILLEQLHICGNEECDSDGHISALYYEATKKWLKI